MRFDGSRGGRILSLFVAPVSPSATRHVLYTQCWNRVYAMQASTDGLTTFVHVEPGVLPESCAFFLEYAETSSDLVAVRWQRKVGTAEDETWYLYTARHPSGHYPCVYFVCDGDLEDDGYWYRLSIKAEKGKTKGSPPVDFTLATQRI